MIGLKKLLSSIADFVIDTDQNMQQVEKQVVNIIKTMRKSND